MNLEELKEKAAELKSKKEAVVRDYDDYTLRKIRSNLFLMTKPEFNF